MVVPPLSVAAAPPHARPVPRYASLTASASAKLTLLPDQVAPARNPAITTGLKNRATTVDRTPVPGLSQTRSAIRPNPSGRDAKEAETAAVSRSRLEQDPSTPRRHFADPQLVPQPLTRASRASRAKVKSKPTSGSNVHIPFEVLVCLAEFIDKPTAHALVITSKGLRDAGEMRLWRSISITGGTAAQARKRRRMSCERALAGQVDRRLSVVKTAFERYPSRLTALSALRIEVSDGLNGTRANDLDALLESARHSLTRLDITSNPKTSGGAPKDLRAVLFMQRLASSSPWTRIRKLSMSLPSPAIALAVRALSRFPNLCELDLRWTPVEDTSWRDSPRSASVSSNPLRSLRKLTFERLGKDDDRGDMNIAALDAIVSSASNIEAINIIGPRRGYLRAGSGQVPSSIQALERLSTCVWMLNDTWPYHGVGPLQDYAEWKTSSLTQVATLFHPYETREGMPLGDLLIYVRRRRLDLAQTIRLSLCTGRRLSLRKCLLSEDGRVPLIDVCQDIPPKATEFLLLAAHLEEVRYDYDPRRYDSLHDPSAHLAPIFVPSTEWETRGDRGLVVREYTWVDLPGKSFWHVRALVRRQLPGTAGGSNADPYARFPQPVAIPSWTDYTSYAGMMVPRKVLDEVYAAAGTESRWVTGGRQMALGEGQAEWAAWKVLEDFALGGGQGDQTAG